MNGQRRIAVFGATGAQGGSVARALLGDAAFRVRALTRHPRRGAARELRRRGAEVVQADLEDASSLEAALRGTFGVFLGKRVADLAKQLGLNYVVYSGLENVQKLTSGQLKVPHFDGKGEVEEYFRAIGVPMTSLRLSSYFENFFTLFRPRKAPGGEGYELAIPMGEVPMDGMAVADLGPVVVQLMKEPERFTGKEIGLSTCKLTVAEYAAVMSRYTREAVRDAQMSLESYEKLDFPGSREVANMFRFYRMGPARDIALTLALNPMARTFEEWMADQRAAFQDL